MRRPVTALLLVIAAGLSLSLVGCSGSSETDSTSSTTSKSSSSTAGGAGGEKMSKGGVLDVNDAGAPSGTTTGVDNGKKNSAPPKNSGPATP